ncbi:hypothetical protein C8R45DRAFT_890207 [Mycena sanguinolenta]|nr:hypothetical protein C8R45DRAFT_890207 [Mycena sanguinolenta]
MLRGFPSLKSNDIVGTELSVEFFSFNCGLWLSQANHIFTALQISSDFQDYVIMDDIHFKLTISTTADMPTGFLFLCPPKQFQSGPSSLKWPECPAYWSLNSSGIERLTPEDAADLGFPSFVLSTEVLVFSWDANVYAGLRGFHLAKGFDPDSQDVARHLGHKLYELSGPFAHIDKYSEDGDDTSQCSMDEEFDDEPDSTPMNHDSVLASTHQNMEQIPFSSAFGDIVDSTSGLLPMDWEASAAYDYNIQLSQSFTTSDFSTSDFNSNFDPNFNPNFDASDFGNDLSWRDYLASNGPDPSLSSPNYQQPIFHDGAQFFPATSFPQPSLLAPSSFSGAPIVATSSLNYNLPMLDDAAQFFPATSLPQLLASLQLPAASSFQIAPIFDSPVASSSLNYQPPMLDDAARFLPATFLPQLPASFPAASSFQIAPVIDAPVGAWNLNYQPPMLTDGAQLFTSLPQFPVLLAPSPFVVDTPVADTHSTVLGKRKMRDETDADLAGMVQGSRAPKAPKRFDI